MTGVLSSFRMSCTSSSGAEPAVLVVWPAAVAAHESAITSNIRADRLLMTHLRPETLRAQSPTVRPEIRHGVTFRQSGSRWRSLEEYVANESHFFSRLRGFACDSGSR